MNGQIRKPLEKEKPAPYLNHLHRKVNTQAERGPIEMGPRFSVQWGL